jgi:putative ABC transport system permease protein
MKLYPVKPTLKLGIKSLWMHKLRSMLTCLGIIFGVSSVIAMLAIGEGASKQAQEQIAKLGSRNIIIKTVKPPQSPKASDSEQTINEYGLRYSDAERIRATIADVEVVVPLRRSNQQSWYRSNRASVEVLGTVPWYPEMTPVEVVRGRFLAPIDMERKQAVCVIDISVMDNLLGFDEPIGQVLKISQNYYKIVGVVSEYNLDIDSDELANLRSTGGGVVGSVYIPLTTMRSRFGEINIQFGGSNGASAEKVELQEITVKVGSDEAVLAVRDVLDTLLAKFHKKKDYQIVVPLELLRQAARTKRIFNIVLGSIAAISLLVGGIGIMNIMLATVSERTREIGIRRALGAKKVDIVVQFLSETVLLTVLGGVLGIVLGLVIPVGVTLLGDMPTVITPFSLVLAFGISAAVGVTFGMYPAYRAATMDPIESLRHE